MNFIKKELSLSYYFFKSKNCEKYIEDLLKSGALIKRVELENDGSCVIHFFTEDYCLFSDNFKKTESYSFLG